MPEKNLKEDKHAGHTHNHVPVIRNLNRAFIIGIVLNFAYVIIQIIVGLRTHSLALLSDAGHNFLEVAGLSLAMVAFKLSKSKSTEKYTYSRKKASILIALLVFQFGGNWKATMPNLAFRKPSDYSYSNTIVYNNFSWSENPIAKQKATVESAA